MVLIFLPTDENFLTTTGWEIAAFVSLKSNLSFLREWPQGFLRGMCLDPFLTSLH